MQKIVSSLILVIAMTATASAQDFYVRAGMGYAFAQAGQTMDGTANPYSGSVNNTSSGAITYNIDKASYAAGVHVFMGGGYMFSKNIGIDLSFDINAAPKKYNMSDYNVSVGSVPSNVFVLQYAKTPDLFCPSIVLQTSGEKINVYSRTGLALPVSTKVIQVQTIENLPGTGAQTIDQITFETKNTFTMGLTAAIGIQYKLSDEFMIWGEMNGISMSLFTKQSNLISYTQNGVNYTSYVPDSNKVITYSKSFTGSSGDYYHQPAYAQPFSNVGITVGVKLLLSKNAHSAPHRQMGKNYENNDSY